MPFHEKIDYIEIPAINIEACKAFFTKVLAGNSRTMGLNTQHFLMPV